MPAGAVQVHRGAFGQDAGQAQLEGRGVLPEDEQGAEQQREGQHHQQPRDPARASVHAASLGRAAVAPPAGVGEGRSGAIALASRNARAGVRP